MSTLKHDADVVQDGRRDPLKDVDAPLRDQVVEKLYRKLDEMEIGAKVEQLWNESTSNIQPYLNRQAEFLKTIDEHIVREGTGASGTSQVHLPVALTAVKVYHARMFQALMGIDPPFHVKARNEASIERTQTVADTMRWYVNDGANHGKGIEEVVDRWVWDFVSGGRGIKKWRWDVEYTRFVDVQEVPEPTVTYAVIDGQMVEQPGPPKMVEKEVTVTRKCFDGPVLDLVNHEDIRIIGGGDDPDLADAVLHQEYVTASRLWMLADRKIFKAKAVEAVITAGPDREDGGVGNAIKTDRAQYAGRNQLGGSEELDRYQIVEAHLKLDVDGSGINTDVIAWVHPRTRTLLRATYLRRVSPSGERPFVVAPFHPRKGQMPAGLIELIYPLTVEMDAIHNMRLEWGQLSVMPFGFYRASSGIDPKTIYFEPGALIPVDNPQTDVFFPQLGNRTVFGFQEEQAIQTMIERLTSVSDLSLGVMGGQGATRTATGSRIMAGEMSSNLDVYLKRLNRAWKKSLRYLLHSLQHRMPAGLSFRLTGEDGKDYWRTVRGTEELEGDYDIEVLPNSASSNQQIQIDTAQQILGLTSNPLDIQLGIIGPMERYEAIKNMLQALGVRDFGRYLIKVDPNARLTKLTPEEEANRVLRGMATPVVPEMDHEGFIAWWSAAKDDDMLLGQFTEEQTILLEKQAIGHAQMLQSLQQMAAQQSNANQMRANAAMSQQQTATTAPAATSQ